MSTERYTNKQKIKITSAGEVSDSISSVLPDNHWIAHSLSH